MYLSVSSTLVTVCAFNPSCFLINVSTSTSIRFLSMAINNYLRKVRRIEVSCPRSAANLLHLKPFNFNYTLGTGTPRVTHDIER